MISSVCHKANLIAHEHYFECEECGRPTKPYFPIEIANKKEDDNNGRFERIDRKINKPDSTR